MDIIYPIEEIKKDLKRFFKGDFQANKESIREYIEDKSFYRDVYGYGKNTASAPKNIIPKFLFHCASHFSSLRPFKIIEGNKIKGRHSGEFLESASFSPRPLRDFCFLFDSDSLIEHNKEKHKFPKYYCNKEFKDKDEEGGSCVFFGDNEWKKVKAKNLGDDRDKYYDLPKKGLDYFVDRLYHREAEWLIEGTADISESIRGITLQDKRDKYFREIILPLLFKYETPIEKINEIKDTIFTVDKKVKDEGQKRYYSYKISSYKPFNKQSPKEIVLCRLSHKKQKEGEHTFDYGFKGINPQKEGQCTLKDEGKSCYLFEDKDKKEINPQYDHCIILNKEGYSVIKSEKGRDFLIDHRRVFPFYEGDKKDKMLGYLKDDPFTFDRYGYPP